MSTVAGEAALPGRGALRGARRQRTARSRRGRLRRALRLVIATLLLMLALELVFYLLLVPRLRLTTVTVATDLALSDAEVLAMAGLTGDLQFFSIDAAAVERHLEQHLLIRDATVSMRFPDTLRLELTARKAAAAVLVKHPDGTLRSALADEEGLVFLAGLAPWGQEAAVDVPVLSGLAAQLVQPGRYLPAAVGDVLGDLHRLTVDDPVLATLISELRVVPVGAPPDAEPLTADRLAGGFDLLVYPIGFDTALRFGSELTAQRLAEAFVLLDLMRARTADTRLPAHGELDLRRGSPVAVSAPPGGARTRGGAAHGE